MASELRTESHTSCPRWWIAALALALVAPASLRAQLEPPSKDTREVTQLVAQYLEGVHLRGRRLDDAASKNMFRKLFSDLDPLHLYFLASDVDQFRANETRIDDMLKTGDLEFAYKLFKRFLERVDERTKAVVELLAAEPDFTVDESIELDREDASFPADADAAKEIWRKRIKLMLLERIADGETLEEARDLLRKRYEGFARRLHQTDNDELLQLFLNAAATTYDPHTAYLSPRTLEDFEISMRLELQGIGALLQSEDGFTVVKSIVPGGAAARDERLQPEDKIEAVAEGDEGEFVDLYNMKLSDVVKRIRGKAGTRVRLKVIHANKERETIDLVRAKIELAEKAAQGEIHEVKSDGGSTMKIGVVDLPSFYMDLEAASRKETKDFRSSTRDVEKIIQGFVKEKVDAVVVDLRRNTGGSLTEAINMTGLFIDEGPVVLIKGPRGAIDRKDDTNPGMLWNGPLVVMTSRFSASASEIFAGAIQDHRRGIIVGDSSTHGKGTVQHLVDLYVRNGEAPAGALKITISQFYRPNGRSTQLDGVRPDIELPSFSAHLSEGEAGDYAMANDSIRGVKFTPLDMVNADIVREISWQSRRRREKSAMFQRLESEIRRFVEFKKRDRMPLQKEKFMAAYKLQSAVELAQEFGDVSSAEGAAASPDSAAVRNETPSSPPGENAPDGDSSASEGDERVSEYLQEVLAITRDYVRALS